MGFDSKNLLQELCLTCIGSNLDLFLNAGSPRQLEFLKRAYSKKLMKKCSPIFVGEVEADFLVNRYLRELDLADFFYVDYNRMKFRLVEIADTLVKLAFSIRWDIEDVEDLLLRMPNLKSLDLFWTLSSNDHTLEIVSQSCPLLEELYICTSGLHYDEDILNLSNLNLLDALETSGGGISEWGIVYVLSRIPTLKYLSYRRLPEVILHMHVQDLRNNTLEKAMKYNLLALDFSGVSEQRLRDALTVCAVVCPNVEKLKMVQSGIGNFDLWSKFENMKELYVKEPDETVEVRLSVDNLLELRGSKLTRLTLYTASVSISTVTNNCPNLRTLKLYSVWWDSFGSSDLKPLNFLSKLTIYGPHSPEDFDVESVVAALWSGSQNLQALFLKHIGRFSEEMNAKVLKCSNRLKHVQIHHSDFEFSFMQSLLTSSPLLESLLITDFPNISKQQFDVLYNQLKEIKRKVIFCWYWAACLGIENGFSVKIE